MSERASVDGKRFLAVFAHPDDETTSCAGAFPRFSGEGAVVTVITATRGEGGTLGTGGVQIAREDLPKAREQEQRAVSDLMGVKEVVYLDYIDGQVDQAPHRELVNKVLSVMQRVAPEVVFTFGPQGISRHDDYVAVSRAATDAFHVYNDSREGRGPASLFCVAIPKEMAEKFGIDIDGIETEPTTAIDIRRHLPIKVEALRTYKSQEAAQMVAEAFEGMPQEFEYFHRAYPAVTDGALQAGLW